MGGRSGARESVYICIWGKLHLSHRKNICIYVIYTELNQLQGKEVTVIPDSVINLVLLEIKKEKQEAVLQKYVDKLKKEIPVENYVSSDKK